MSTHPDISRILPLLIVAALLAASGVTEAQAPARTPMTLQLSFSSTPSDYTNATQFPLGPLYTLEEGTAGSGSQLSPCASPGQNEMTLAWMSPPLFANPNNARATYVGNATIEIGIAPNGTNPIAKAGAVTLDLIYGYINADGTVHIHNDYGQVPWNAPTSGPTAGLPVPLGPFEGPATFAFDFDSSQNPPPSPGRIWFQLTVTCDNVADFVVTFGALPAIQYVWGDPSEADTDGDGFPDSIDNDADADGFDKAAETAVGASDVDAAITPNSESSICSGSTYQEVFDETGDPNECPAEGGFPLWLLILLVVLGVLLLLALAGGAVLVSNKKIKMSVSHDGFQAIEKGQNAEYELTLVASGKKEEVIPVEMSLKGVPEDWSAVLEPSQLTLVTGEAAEARTVLLRVIPPPEATYESEAQITVTATPTDADGKTSAMKPGTSVKTKTIVNIGVAPPEGEGKKPKKTKTPKAEEAAAAPAEEAGTATEEAPKKKGLGGMLRRKKKAEGAEEAAPAAAAVAAAPAVAAAAPGEAGKPQIAMGKMVHDPADFSAGDAVKTTVNVRNKGDGPVSNLRLSLFVNDQRADSQDVDLAPAESKEVTFNWTAQPDENRVRIKGGLKGA